MSKNLESKTASGMTFKMLERISVQLVSLVVSVVLARLLDPADYGIIAMANVLITVLNVFVNYGLGTAIIHKKNADQTDISTCFWASLMLAVVLYAVVFVLAAPVAAYFQMELLKPVIRILGLQLIFAIINSVQTALVAKQFMYRQYFVLTLIASVISGIVGIAMAYWGFGIWSLVVQTLVSIGLVTLFSAMLLRWKPAAVFSVAILKEQIVYAWRLLVVGFVDCVYAELRSVIIAKKYSSEDLAFYNKGAQFPKLISNTVNQSVIAVLFPVMSILQDDAQKVRDFVKKTLSLLTFVLFPVMVGLLAVSEDLVLILLTDKWLFCVPYMQVLCLAYLITPVQSVYKQALKALGQTKILMNTNMWEKIIGILLLLLAVPFGVDAICWSFVIYHIVGLLLYMVAVKEIIGYHFWIQLKDFLPNVVLSAAMLICVSLIGELSIIPYLRLLLQVVTGAAVYVLVALITKNANVFTIKQKIKNMLIRSK